MARKKKHAEHVNHERWLVSYADFITLLFAFFVVMFAASNADSKKAGQVAQAVQVAFKEMAIFTPGSKVVPLSDKGGGSGAPSTAALGNGLSSLGIAPFVDGGSGAGKGSGTAKAISEVKAKLETMLKAEVANHTVRLAEDSRG